MNLHCFNLLIIIFPGCCASSQKWRHYFEAAWYDLRGGCGLRPISHHPVDHSLGSPLTPLVSRQTWPSWFSCERRLHLLFFALVVVVSRIESLQMEETSAEKEATLSKKTPLLLREEPLNFVLLDILMRKKYSTLLLSIYPCNLHFH